MLASKEADELMLQQHVSAEVKSLADEYSVKALAKVLVAINDARRKLSLNVNALATVDSLLFTILEARYTCR